ncbi:hypothetical protein B0T16DRAFT_462782 [Cercophora newfieldiana]|uniref:NACHT domain-containing protein n=1 Tax=Cercophora newfieldiana TaxID=92897 RepID=A0AA40CI21_9PEZI|nr:hypothetical protein B0T16DRAFT_462782 [Cercophora newfieldiana]
MDPLAALGVAGNVVAFAQFAGSILNGARKIHDSTSGASDQVESLEQLFGALSSFAAKLKPDPNSELCQDPNTSFLPPAQAQQLQKLASSCNADCDRLLALLRGLNVKRRSGPEWWKSLHVALLEQLKSTEVTQLRQRIGEYQASITTLLCTISSQSINTLRGEIQALSHAFRSSRLGILDQMHTISSDLKMMTERVEALQKQNSQGVAAANSSYEALQEVLAVLEQGHTLSKNLEVLSALQFDERLDRHQSIRKAHETTFQWVFERPLPSVDGDEPLNTENAGSEHTRLLQWLQMGDGAFWISGKPGSGKSTLMRFLAPGSPLQKSDEGLLRSLLFNVLDQCPALIPEVLHQRWQAAGGAGIASGGSRMVHPWSISELQGAISSLQTKSSLPLRFCFFIDGLDEYSGDSHRLCRLVVELSRTPDIKICVSSRPWNVFEEYFGAALRTKIYVHKLTLRDIHQFTISELGEESNWVAAGLGDERQAIIDQVTQRAQGVFLWVFLVARQLKEGIINHDSPSDIRKRLDEIPTDLEEFLRMILFSVESFYREKMASTIAMALAAEEPLDVNVYAFQDLEYEHKDFLSCPHEQWPAARIEEFERLFRRRLSSRCKGLLEISGRTVTFLHRTVRDFLLTAEMQTFISSQTKRKHTPNLSIFQGYAYWFVYDGKPALFSTIKLQLYSALQHVGYALDNDESNHNDIFDRIDRLERLIQSKMLTDDFRHVVFQVRLVSYLQHKLPQDLQYFGDSYSRIYGSPLEQMLNLDFLWSAKALALLQSLLQNGHDPNKPNLNKACFSPWAKYMQDLLCTNIGSQTTPNTRRIGSAVEVLRHGALEKLLQFGASPNPHDGGGDRMNPWEGLIILFFGGEIEKSADGVGSVISVFDAMLSDADLDAECPCVYLDPTRPLGSRCRIIHRPTGWPLVAAQIKSRRLHAWQYICERVCDINSDGGIGAARRVNFKHQYPGLIAEMIRLFIIRARHPTMDEREILPFLKVFSPELRKSVVDVIKEPPGGSSGDAMNRAERIPKTETEPLCPPRDECTTPTPETMGLTSLPPTAFAPVRLTGQAQVPQLPPNGWQHPAYSWQFQQPTPPNPPVWAQYDAGAHRGAYFLPHQPFQQLGPRIPALQQQTWSHPPFINNHSNGYPTYVGNGMSAPWQNRWDNSSAFIPQPGAHLPRTQPQNNEGYIPLPVGSGTHLPHRPRSLQRWGT